MRERESGLSKKNAAEQHLEFSRQIKALELRLAAVSTELVNLDSGKATYLAMKAELGAQLKTVQEQIEHLKMAVRGLEALLQRIEDAEKKDHE